MSLNIDIDRVVAVLLADGWHKVAKKSFTLDAYEFQEGGRNVLGGSQVAGVPSTGAAWTEPNGEIVCAPLTAVLAVKHK